MHPNQSLRVANRQLTTLIRNLAFLIYFSFCFLLYYQVWVTILRHDLGPPHLGQSVSRIGKAVLLRGQIHLGRMDGRTRLTGDLQSSYSMDPTIEKMGTG